MFLFFYILLFLVLQRFGIGRFTTEAEVDYTIAKTVEHVKRLREMRLVN
jgi:cysteine sulfinate desulfinase/cysteine desulfurase-like protein